MTRAATAQRLAAIEDGLDPLAAVFRWLEEAHAHGSLGAYVRAVHEGSAQAPYAVIPERAAAAGRKASPDRSHGKLARAEERAVGDVLVLLELVLLLRTSTMALLREGWLRLDALRWEWVARSLDTDPDDAPDALADHDRVMVSWGRRFDALRSEFAIHDAARIQLEARHFAGHTTLFPDDVEEHRALWEVMDRVAAMAGLAPTPERGDANVRATTLALLEHARAGALDLLGRRIEAGEVMGRLLRAPTDERSSSTEPG